jgi:hypothetical protein
LEVCSCAADITCGNVVLPYNEGSRVPRRLRLGPLIRRIDFAIVKKWCSGNGKEGWLYDGENASRK